MAKEASAANTEFEDFDPPSEWVEDEESGTLIVMLPGFRREQLRVQVTSTGTLRISGERPIDINKRRRFVKEHSLPANCDITRIGAKLEGGLLYVKLPKPSAHASPTQPPMTQEPPAMSQPPPPSPPPAPAAPTPKADQQMPSQEVTPPKTDEVTQKPSEKEKEQESEPKEKGKVMDESAKQLEKEKKKKKKKEKIGPSQVLEASPSVVYRVYRESFVGIMEGLKRQEKVVNLVLAILFVLLLGLYVKDAIKSSSGGSKIQEL